MLFYLWLGKLLRSLSLIGGGGGSALPGAMIEKTYPQFLRKSLDKLPEGVIIVTGTNGKTTTTKLIAELLEGQDKRVLTNRSGGNFVRGIISTIVKHMNLFGDLSYDIAVFEQDEAYAAQLAKRYEPRGVVALNVGRDQLDRFGEIDKTAELIGQVVAVAEKFVVLNANDPRISKLKKDTKAKVIWFGHSQDMASHFSSDDQHHAEKSGFSQATTPNVELLEFSGGRLDVRVGKKAYELKTSLSGGQNALNVTAAIATVFAVEPKASIVKINHSLQNIGPAFGRGEIVELKNGGQLKLQLVKNPASFRYNLQHIESGYEAIGIAINDDYADGRDVSWLWDVDFKSLSKIQAALYCGGTRAFDMANRLKYDQIETDITQTSLSKFMKMTLGHRQKMVIFCTYTSMLKLRKLLKPYAKELKGGLKS